MRTKRPKTFKETYTDVMFHRRERRYNDDLAQRLGLKPKPYTERQLPMPLTRIFYGPKDKPDPRANRPRPMMPQDYDPSKTINSTLKPERAPIKDFIKRAFDPRRMAPTWKTPLNDLFDPFAEIFELVTPTALPNGMPLRPLNPNGEYWIKTHGDFTCSSGTYPVEPDNIYTSLTNYKSCLTGQAIATQGLAISVPPGVNHTVQGWWRWNKSITTRRYGNFARFVKTTRLLDMGTVPTPRAFLPPHPYHGVNPNWERAFAPPTLFTPPEPPPYAEPPTEYQKKPIRQMDISPSGDPMPWAPPVPPHRRAPPKTRTHESKGQSPDKNLGPKLADVMDKISEGCDAIDAIYAALPPEVDKKWQCSKIAGGFGGQYEVGGCDCKARAVWHNAHKIDLKQALINLAMNEGEDKLIGKGQGARDDLRPRKWKNYRPKKRK